jgi:hypothetical protein
MESDHVAQKKKVLKAWEQPYDSGKEVMKN